MAQDIISVDPNRAVEKITVETTKMKSLRSAPPTNEQLKTIPNFIDGGKEQFTNFLRDKTKVAPTEISTQPPPNPDIALVDLRDRAGGNLDPKSFKVFSKPEPPYLSLALIHNDKYVLFDFELLPGDNAEAKVKAFIESKIPPTKGPDTGDIPPQKNSSEASSA